MFTRRLLHSWYYPYICSLLINNLPELKLSLNTMYRKAANKIRQWANSNKLPINESKSEVSTITAKHLVSKINDELGITVGDNRLINIKKCIVFRFNNWYSSSLSFHCHVENLCNKLASHRYKIRAFLSLKQRLSFYNAIIHPVMSYTDIIWSSCDKELLCRVLKLQKHAANQIILYADRLARFVTLIISWDGYLFMNRVKLTNVLFF